MPLPGYGVAGSSQGNVGGTKYTRFAGPLVIGQLSDNISGGPGYAPSGVVLVQTTGARNTPGILSTAAAVVARSPFVYILQTTNPIATSSFANGDSAPPYSDCGAALAFDAGRSKIGVYTTAGGAGTWLWTAAMTSS